MATLIRNKKATFNYEVMEKFEAGIELFGFEVKSIKDRRMSIAGAFVVLRGGEAWLLIVSVPPYQAKNTPQNYEPERTRRLLLRKSEIRELIGKSAQKGLTIVPIRVYTKQGKIKILIGGARHKKTKDKRETIRKREATREIARTLKG